MWRVRSSWSSRIASGWLSAVRATVLLGEMRALGCGQSYPTFGRRIRDRGLRPECGSCSPGRDLGPAERRAGSVGRWLLGVALRQPCRALPSESTSPTGPA